MGCDAYVYIMSNHILLDDSTILDFHTHSMRHADSQNVQEIVSIHLGQQKHYHYFTVGMHPWWTEQPVSPNQKDDLVKLLGHDNCLAMGEMGLDNLKGPEMGIQMNILRSLLAIADEMGKSVIIHCVRAFDQLIQIKKEFPNIRNWCVHGYGRHTTLAKQLIDQGFYVSLMPTMPLAKYQQLFDSLPHDRLFLETDSMKEADITTVYSNVAAMLNVDVSDLCAQINHNARAFF